MRLTIHKLPYSTLSELSSFEIELSFTVILTVISLAQLLRAQKEMAMKKKL